MNAHARHPIRLSSFNGATTFQPWKSPRCCCLSNGRHCFNGATTFQPWKWYEASIGLLSDDASMGPRLFSRGNLWGAEGDCIPATSFNGATTFQPWKWLIHPDLPFLFTASMGPRLFSRGNRTSGDSSENVPWLLQWGHDFSAVEIHPGRHKGPPGCCFNGATTFQPWKSQKPAQESPATTPLQWGHDFSAVEI